MEFFLYRIDNIINDKFYYGVHKTNNIDDGYMGSGVLISRAIKTHGIGSFKRTIICKTDSVHLLYLLESMIVTEELLKNPFCYNIVLGGGMPPSCKGRYVSVETRKKQSISAKNRELPTEETKRKISNANIGKIAWNKGVKHSEETCRKISKSTAGKKKPMRSESHRISISKVHLGKKLSEESIKKRTETRRLNREKLN